MYSFPEQIKGVIDLIFSFCVAARDIYEKECALIACCEEDDVSVMDGLLFPYKKSIDLLKWKASGDVRIPGVYNAGDINNTDGGQKAAELAKLL